jgi:DNA-binding transcriptional MerR regulator
MSVLDKFQHWEGDIWEFAEVAESVLQQLGRSDVAAPNIRLIRDYAQRGILSPTTREGKLARYTFQHLKELVAARILVSEGVPLAKIAEQFEHDRDIVIVVLGMPPRPKPVAASARARWEELGGTSASTVPGVSEHRSPYPSPSVNFMRGAVEATGRRQELGQALQRLGSESDVLSPRQLTHLALTDWCTLVIDSDRLRSLSAEEADDLGRAVSAALSDPRIRKGEKP